MPQAPSKPPQGKPQRRKDELFTRVLDAALRLEITRGHLRWKMTDLSRASGVTRSLIYYYFGSTDSKNAILRAAIDILGEEFFGLSAARQRLWDAGQAHESILKTRELVKRMPHISLFYLTQRQPGSPLAAKMAALERRYQQKLALRFPGADPELLNTVFAALFGIVALSSAPEPVLGACVGALFNGLRPRGAPDSA